MRNMMKLVAVVAATFALTGAAAAAVILGGPPEHAGRLVSALQPSNWILIVAGAAMIGLAGGTRNATSAAKDFRPVGPDLAVRKWLARLARPAEYGRHMVG